VIAAAWGAATDRGRVRAVNEDSMVAEPPVFIVADGMGGHAAGDLASRIAIDEFAVLAGSPRLSVIDALAPVSRANRAILEAAREDRARDGMGTTIAGLVVVRAAGSEHWMAFNIGDSRVYRLAGNEFHQLTADHSEAEELVATGVISREEARVYRRRHIVTRSLGTEPPPEADCWVFPPEARERFIVCSDGLTGELADAEIASLAREIGDPQKLARALVDRSLEAGGRDNITVIVVDGQPGEDGGAVDEDTRPRSGTVTP